MAAVHVRAAVAVPLNAPMPTARPVQASSTVAVALRAPATGEEPAQIVAAVVAQQVLEQAAPSAVIATNVFRIRDHISHVWSRFQRLRRPDPTSPDCHDSSRHRIDASYPIPLESIFLAVIRACLAIPWSQPGR